MRKKALALLTAFAVCLALLPVLPCEAAEAQQPLPDGVYVIASALPSDARMVLDVEGATAYDGADAYLYTDVRQTNQRWLLTHRSDGYYSLRALHSGKALSVSSSGLFSILGGDAVQYDYSGSAGQLWKPADAGNGNWYLVNKKNGSYLTVTNGTAANESPVSTFVGFQTASQAWKLISVDEDWEGGGTLDCTAIMERKTGGDGTWEWVSSTKTLILNNLFLKADEYFSSLGGTLAVNVDKYRKECFGILLPEGSTVVLTGKNDVYGYTAGISCAGDLSIVSASLRIPQDGAKLEAGGITRLIVSGGTAIRCAGKLELGGGELMTGSSLYSLRAAQSYAGEKAAALTLRNKAILDASAGAFKIGAAGVTYTKSGVSTFYQYAGEWVLTGTTNVAGYGLTVEEGVNTALWVQDLNIDLSKCRYSCAIDIRPGATVRMLLKGESHVTSGTNCAGIRVGDGAALTIDKQSTGTLFATGGAYAAAIGGSYRDSVGSITVEGGTVFAAGSSGSAGIGTGRGGSGGTVTLEGGTVCAAGGFGGPAIGAGVESKGTKVVVSGGTVVARGGYEAPAIGAGENCSGVSVFVTGGDITAKGGDGCGALGAGEGSTNVTVSVTGGNITAAGGYGSPALGNPKAGGTGADGTGTDGTGTGTDGTGTDGTGTGGTGTGTDEKPTAQITVSGGSLALSPGLNSKSPLGNGVTVTGGSIGAVAYFEEVPEPEVPEDKTLMDVGGLNDYSLEADELAEKRAAEAKAKAEAEAAAAALAGLTDVKDGDWFAEAVRSMVKAGAMKPLQDGSFGPDGEATRAVFVYALYKISGGAVPGADTERYSDVDYNGPYGEAVLWGTANGVILGYGDGRFGPDDRLTREQACAIFLRCAKANDTKLGSSTTSEFFQDDGEISTWAWDAVYICKKAGLVVGYEDDSFLPGGNISRAELASMLQRYDENYA